MLYITNHIKRFGALYTGGVRLFKSLHLNIRLFGIYNGLKLPILIYGNCSINLNRHNILINTALKPGLVHIGKQCTKLMDNNATTYICVDGKLIIQGFCVIGSGSKLLVPGILCIGNNFSSSGNLRICCENEIHIGNDCMISWDVTIMDTDYHPIYLNTHLTNPSKPIYIGNSVWIGSNNIILKGVHLTDNIVVSAGNIIRHSLKEPHSVYCSKDNLIAIRSDISWSKDIIR